MDTSLGVSRSAKVWRCAKRMPAVKNLRVAEYIGEMGRSQAPARSIGWQLEQGNAAGAFGTSH